MQFSIRATAPGAELIPALRLSLRWLSSSILQVRKAAQPRAPCFGAHVFLAAHPQVSQVKSASHLPVSATTAFAIPPLK